MVSGFLTFFQLFFKYQYVENIRDVKRNDAEKTKEKNKSKKHKGKNTYRLCPEKKILCIWYSHQ